MSEYADNEQVAQIEAGEPSWNAVALPGGLASAGIDFPLPGGAVTLIGSVSFSLVADANAADRQVVVSLADGSGQPVYQIAAKEVQTTGQTVRYSFAPDVPEFGSAALGAMGGPFVGSASGADNLAIQVAVSGAQAGDVLTNGRLLALQAERYPASDE